MTSKQRALLNSIAIALPLVAAFSYSVLFSLEIPESIILPTAGGGLMNLGFWAFYPKSIKPIPELSESIFGKYRNMFLLSGILHFIAISLLLVFDIKWVFELF